VLFNLEKLSLPLSSFTIIHHEAERWHTATLKCVTMARACDILNLCSKRHFP
jgi:hypothetical protein